MTCRPCKRDRTVSERVRTRAKNLIANINAGRGLNFTTLDQARDIPLPIMLVNLQGATVGGVAIDPTNKDHYSNALFTNATLVNSLNPLNPSVLTFANNLAFSTSTFLNNRNSVLNSTLTGITPQLKALATPNFFIVNPDVVGDPFVVDNGNQSWYDALQMNYGADFRRTCSSGQLYLLEVAVNFMPAVPRYSLTTSICAELFEQNIGPYDVPG
jgi:hypothetical protein